MMEKTREKRPEHFASSTSTANAGSSTSGKRPSKIFENLPGTDEGKAAMLEFEMSELDFVEEQQAFDFGAEFNEAPPTAAMLDTGAYIAPGLTDEELLADEADFSGDSDAQMDFEEAARLIALEEAERALQNPEELELASHGETRENAMMLEDASLTKIQVNADTDLMMSIQSIPGKMAFKIGEVAEMIGVKQYVLRYWESEFDALRPRKSKNGQRVYTRREVETALMIKKLLYTDRFSIEGARAALKQLKTKVREEKGWSQLLVSHDHVKDGLKSLVDEIRKLKEALA
jgi:DNA-binding transcriptional MerR regulator